MDRSPDNGDDIRYGILVGTVIGLGAGIRWSLRRPSGEAMIEYRDGTLRAQAMPQLELGVTAGGRRRRG